MQNKIVKISRFKNCRLKNTHNGHIGCKKDIYVVEFENGDTRLLDWRGGFDFTNTSYFEILMPKKIKEEVLFIDEFHFDL